MPHVLPVGLDVELSSLLSGGESDTQRTHNLPTPSERGHLDLEASLLPASSPITRLTDNAEIDQKRTGNRRWHHVFDVKLLRFSLYQLGSLVYTTSCRVVDIGEDNTRFSRYHKLHSLSLINTDPSAIENPATPTSDQILAMKWLQRILYSAWSPPIIFFLILFQGALLVVDTTNLGSKQRREHFFHPGSWVHICYIAIFSLYTLELLLRGAAYLSDQGSKALTKPRLTLQSFYIALDFLAVVSFWVSLTIALSKFSESRFRQVLAMFSALCILRLLRITAGTDAEITVIFEALKNSRSKLGRVGAFTCFFWLLFAIIGVQVFKSSLRRSCILPGTDPSSTRTNFEESQFCGGYLVDEDGILIPRPWLTSNGNSGASSHKGYLCPPGMLCQESNNPYNGTVSFDNIFQSLELVFVTFSANTFSLLMYNIIDSDGLVAALFFAAVIIVLYFWLLILLIGVIMGSIQQSREKACAPKVMLGCEPVASGSHLAYKQIQRSESLAQKIYRQTKWFWIAMITFNLIAQAQRASGMSRATRQYIDYSESIVTWVLLAEIVLRLVLDGTSFFRSKKNLADLFLAIVTSTMQLKAFQQSGRTYAWFTAFSVARSYRIFWAVNPVRDIMVRVLFDICHLYINSRYIKMLSFNYFPALLQLCGFLFLLIFLVSVLATALFKATSSNETSFQDQPFSHLWVSFLGIYQIFTGEDWTKHLYAVTERDSGQRVGWIGAIFIIGWFAVSSIVILNMFLSRVDDSLNLPDDQKRLKQVENFFRKQNGSFLSTSVAGNSQVSEQTAPIAFHADCCKDTLTRTTIDAFLGNADIWKQHIDLTLATIDVRDISRYETWMQPGLAWVRTAWGTIISWTQRKNLLKPSRTVVKYYGQLQEGCRLLLNQDGYSWSWSRYTWRNSFMIFINMSIISQVIITCVTTPLYQREYFFTHVYTRRNWFFFVDFGFAILWSVEAVIKIIAAGFIFGPHAYLRGWNLIDAIVLASSWIWVALTWYNVGRSVATVVASFKAFRVLRLLTLNKKVMKEITLVFSKGKYRLFASILVSLSLLTPFAIFSISLFAGQSTICNDHNVSVLDGCFGEYAASEGTGYLAPRATSRPYYSFDNFGQAFYTLFLIVSQEGWTDVMYWARNIPNTLHSETHDSSSNMNALFFVVFNFCGTIFVTALFASVMIHNYTEATGVAYLTYGQKAWMEQKRLLRRVRPSRRPAEPKALTPWKRWCYEIAVKKGGKWHKTMVAVLALYMVVLSIDFFPSPKRWLAARGKPQNPS
jgi:hypothetical protein